MSQKNCCHVLVYVFWPHCYCPEVFPFPLLVPLLYSLVLGPAMLFPGYQQQSTEPAVSQVGLLSHSSNTTRTPSHQCARARGTGRIQEESQEAARQDHTGCREPASSCRIHCCWQATQLPTVQLHLPHSTDLPYVESQRDGIIKIGVGTSCINP